MKSFKIGLSTLLVAGVCLVAFSAKAYWCWQYVDSVYENEVPDKNLMVESGKTMAREALAKRNETTYTNSLGKFKGGSLRPVPGVEKKYKKHNEIIVQMQEAAGNGANIINNTQTSTTNIGISNLGNFSVAKGEMDDNLTVAPYEDRNGKIYTTQELNDILTKQRTAINDFSANAIAMGAAETVNAAGAAAESTPKKRAKQIAKAETLAELYELMLGMDRRIYERSLHASAVEATNAGVEALMVLSGSASISSGR